MMTGRMALVALFLAGTLGLAGCDDADEGDGTGSSSAAPEAPADTQDEEAASEALPQAPEELAEEAFAVYEEGLGTVAAWADDPPDLETAKAEFSAVKEDMITRLVALGRVREDLDEAGRASFNSRLSTLVSGIDTDVFNGWNEMRLHYSQQDAEFGRELMSLNIITQYASFELLKEQEPEEAARLGIE